MSLIVRRRNNMYSNSIICIDDGDDLSYYKMCPNIQLIHPIPLVSKKSSEPTLPCSYIHPEKGKCKFPSKTGTNRCGFHQNK